MNPLKTLSFLTLLLTGNLCAQVDTAKIALYPDGESGWERSRHLLDNFESTATTPQLLSSWQVLDEYASGFTAELVPSSGYKSSKAVKLYAKGWGLFLRKGLPAPTENYSYLKLQLKPASATGRVQISLMRNNGSVIPAEGSQQTQFTANIELSRLALNRYTLVEIKVPNGALRNLSEIRIQGFETDQWITAYVDEIYLAKDSNAGR